MGSLAGKGNHSAGKGNRSAGKGNCSMDNHDSRSEYTRHAIKHRALQSTSLHHDAVSLQSGDFCAVDMLSTTPAYGLGEMRLGEMRMPATAVQVDLLVGSSTYAYSLLGCAQVSPLFPRSMVPLSALSQQAFASSSQGGSEALPQNAVQQREAV